MKNLLISGLLILAIFLVGCDKTHNFMDVDNPNAKDDLKNIIGDGNIPKINTEDLVPDNLSGTRNDAKGYANKIYEDNLEGYVNTAKEGLSGAVQELKGYYNSGVDQLNVIISDKVNEAISGELNKFKIK